MMLARLAMVQRIPVLGKFAGLALRALGVNIPPTVTIGRNLQLPHGAVGLVVHESTHIGKNVKLYQGVTIGRSDVHVRANAAEGGVIIGDRAVIGANAVVLFRAGQVLTIGSDAVIGAGAVLLHSVGPGEIWAGNPAHCVGVRKSEHGD